MLKSRQTFVAKQSLETETKQCFANCNDSVDHKKCHVWGLPGRTQKTPPQPPHNKLIKGRRHDFRLIKIWQLLCWRDHWWWLKQILWGPKIKPPKWVPLNYMWDDVSLPALTETSWRHEITTIEGGGSVIDLLVSPENVIKMRCRFMSGGTL